MTRCTSTIHWTGFLAVVGAVALAVVAAPVLPARPVLPTEVLSLAGLSQVQLDLKPFPDELLDADVRRDQVKASWRKRLARAGIEVTTEPDAPTLSLRVDVVTERSVPAAMTTLVFISLEQDVQVKRLGRDTVLPTFTHYSVNLESKDRMTELFGPLIDGVLDKFIMLVERATKQYR